MLKEFFFEKYFHKAINTADLKHTADVVLDTSVLLSAYQWKDVTLLEVLDVMINLSDLGRLKIPSHVFSEFIDQRPKRIAEIIQKIDKELLNKVQKPPKLISVIPFLDMLDDSEEYSTIQNNLYESLDNYHKKIKGLSDSLRSFFNDDPIMDTLQELIVKSYFELDGVLTSDIEVEAKERLKKRIPPLTGGDSGKKENIYGDYIIWKHILSLKNDVLFITSDKKEDWMLKDHYGNVLSPRRELVEEFYEVSGGKTFRILNPKQFVALYKPEISEGISKDLEIKEEDGTDEIFNFIKSVFLDHDPVGLFSLTEMADEYDPEVRAVIKILPSVTSVNDLAVKIMDIFIKYLGEEFVGSEEKYKVLAKEIWTFMIVSKGALKKL